MMGASMAVIRDLFERRQADARTGQLLHYAVSRDRSDIVEVVNYLVKHGSPVDEILCENDKEYLRGPYELPGGRGTPLHRSVQLKKLNLVKRLLELGADPLKKDDQGHTPRFWAHRSGFTEGQQILAEAEQHCA